MSSIMSQLPELPPLLPSGTTLNGKPIRVPPRVNLGDLTLNNLGTVKKLINCLFPVSYSERFYQDAIDQDVQPEPYNKLIFYQDLPVGVLISRLEPIEAEPPTSIANAASKENGAKENDENEGNGYKLYIMNLGVLAPYRNQGLASKLIHHALTSASQTLSQEPSPSTSTDPIASTSTTSTPSDATTTTTTTTTTTPPSTSQPPLSKKALKKAAQKGKQPVNSTSNLPPPVPTVSKTNDSSSTSKESKEKEEVEIDEKELKKLERERQELKRAKRKIEKVYCHVQVSNEQGRNFWEKWGFKVVETVPNYYRKIEPRDAWLMERIVTPPPSTSST